MVENILLKNEKMEIQQMVMGAVQFERLKQIQLVQEELQLQQIHVLFVLEEHLQMQIKLLVLHNEVMVESMLQKPEMTEM
mmetsp:Transcript_32168/g.31582  ORF Transcript_32168/g.31582 Transcript_32168/m.31582 type:complete len:80 (-) Transcript_32168:529-768(-)|eukprot:CAMPEP_0197017644 /NCGR_PEP_ID=MMETSP1380-20130617/79659_1 /TAXON_ID=5936 /ORGANISM="Euplotes crassus, Strain CT5" /LENGTH=79 /DNA_ID=CAMNT_0042444771 /DNA_START=575 /DNA_END=814 /DNA_ORIENTATION=-